jgi:hypothetical protein
MLGPLACGESARVSEKGRLGFLPSAFSSRSDAEAAAGLGVSLALAGATLVARGATLVTAGGTLAALGITLAGLGSGGVVARSRVAKSRGGTTTGAGMPMSVDLFESARATSGASFAGG